MSDPTPQPQQQTISSQSLKRKSAILPLLALILSSAAIVLFAILIVMVAKSNTTFASEISSLQADAAVLGIQIQGLQQKRIDLTVKSFQNVGDNFSVSIDSVDPHLTGVTMKGAVLNANATKNTDVKFLVTVGKSKQELNIPDISSGYATKFELYVPDVAAQDTKEANMEYESSIISYAISR